MRPIRFALRAATTSILLTACDVAHASQGPGIAPGTASAMTQLLMAIVVYGTCAATVAAALVKRLMRDA